MPRASQMPRTRRLRRRQRVAHVVLLLLLSLGAAVAKGLAGAQWWWPLLGFVAYAAAVGKVAIWYSKRLAARQPEALTADRAELSSAERALAYGVVQHGDELHLPTKTSVVVLAAVVTLMLVVLGVAMLIVDDPGATALGVSALLLGAWLALLTRWIRGTRIRLLPDGIESTMGPRRFYTWIQIPDITINRQIVIVKAAGAPRPRIWIRCGLLEVSVTDAVAMIRRQRAW